MTVWLAAVVVVVAVGSVVGAQTKEINKSLIEAAEKGDLSQVKDLIEEKGADVNHSDGLMTPLMKASYEGHLDVVKFLLEKGADLNPVTEIGWTTLMVASGGGNLDVVKYLVEKGANINAVNKSGWTMLMWASDGGTLDVARYLVEQGTDVNAFDKDGGTALMKASREASYRGNLDVVKFLVEKGADVNAVEEGGYTALLYAHGGHLGVVKFLVEKGADINAESKDGWTAFKKASQGGHLDVVKFLVEKGADVNAEDKYRRTALMEASHGGHLDVVKFLVEKGADVNAEDKYRQTALMEASGDGYLDVVNFLVGKGADVNASDYSGLTALRLASRKKHFDIAKFLVKNGADVNTPALLRTTSLMDASSYGHLDFVKFLIGNGAEVNTSDSSGYTALMCASIMGHLDVVKYLVGNGAEVDVVDKEGKVALDYASEEDRTEIAEYLRLSRVDRKRHPGKPHSGSASTFTYFTQDKNITNINTQLPAKKGLLKKDDTGIVDLGNHQEITKAPRRHLEVTIDIKLEGNKIVFGYRMHPQSDQINDRIPMYQQIFGEDILNTHVYLIFPKEWVLTGELQEIEVIQNSSGTIGSLKACSPENDKLALLLRKLNAVYEGTYELTESDKSEMERTFDNIAENLGTVGLVAGLVKDGIKMGLEELEERRVERLQEKYGDYQIHKIPFHGPEGISLAYTHIGRSSTIYFDVLSAATPGKIFIEIPQITFGLDAVGAMRTASLEGLVYEMAIRPNKDRKIELWTKEFRVAKELLEGNGKPNSVDIKGARRFFIEAAKKGNPLCRVQIFEFIRYGECFFNEEDPILELLLENYEETYEDLCLMADKKVPEAITFKARAILEYTDRGVVSGHDMYSEAEVFRLLFMALESGDASASNWIQRFVHNSSDGVPNTRSRDVRENVKSLIELTKKNAINGNSSAKLSLANLYDSSGMERMARAVGMSIECPPEFSSKEQAALYWCKRAIDQGSPRAHFLIANRYENGSWGLSKDEQKAEEHYILAVNGGVAIANEHLKRLRRSSSTK